MPRARLIAHLGRLGAVLVRRGGRHDLYDVGGRLLAVPRHSWIGPTLARLILGQADGSLPLLLSFEQVQEAVVQVRSSPVA